MNEASPRRRVGPKVLLWGAVTFVAMGLYGVWMPMAGMERFRAFVDRGEWVALIALSLAFVSAALSRKLASETSATTRRALIVGTACALVSSVAFVHYVFVFSYQLPQAPEVVVGETPPEIVAKDFLGDDFSLSSLRGKPAVVLFYRGHW